MKKTVYLIVFSVFITLFSCRNDAIVARVGNYVVKLQEVKSAVSKSRSKAEKSFDDILNQVNALVDEKLMVVAAYREGLDRDSTVLEKVQYYQDGQVYGYMIQKEVISKVVTPEMIKEKYNRQSHEWHVRHIFLPLKDKQSKRREEIIAELNGIRGRLLRGESFDALARQFSRDSLSAGKGGDLGFLKWGDKKWGDSFYSAVSKLTAGQISRVIESDAGFHIVKVEKVRSVDQPPFAEAKNRLQRSFYREKNKMLDSTFFAYVDRLKMEYDANYLDENIDSLLLIIKEKKKENILPRREPVAFLDSLTVEQRNMPLAVYRGGTFTVDQMFNIYNKISPMRRPALTGKKILLQFLDRNVPRRLIIQKGYEKRVHKKADIRNKVKREKEKILAQRARQIFVDERVDITDEKLRKYYEDHLNEFETGAKVEVQEIQVADRETADMVYEKAASGEDFTELALIYNQSEEMKKKNGRIGFIGADNGILGRMAVRMKVGDISKPISTKQHFSIIKILDRDPGVPSPFEKVQARIHRRVRKAQQDSLYQAWMQELKSSTPVYVYKDVLKREFGFTD